MASHWHTAGPPSCQCVHHHQQQRMLRSIAAAPRGGRTLPIAAHRTPHRDAPSINCSRRRRLRVLASSLAASGAPGGGSRLGQQPQQAAALHQHQEHQHDAERKAYIPAMLRRMLRFMGPAIFIPLGDPLVALGDTIFVGQTLRGSARFAGAMGHAQCAGTLELAAMGPANMVFSFSLYVFQGLQVATLSIVATRLRDERRDSAARYLGCGLIMAACMGMLGASVLVGASDRLVAATGLRDAALLRLSAEYLRIRALALPAVLLTMVAQSGKLAQQDSLTPCLSVMMVVVASMAANVVFVGVLGWGLKGAAVTTVATQYLGATALLWALTHPKSTLKPDWAWPRVELVANFLKTMAPLTVVSLSKNTCYLIVQTTAATLPTLCLAAHQASFSLWALGTWTTSPVEQATMAFLPTATQRWQQQALARLAVTMGTCVALAAGGLLFTVLMLGPGLVVKDPLVQPMMSLVALQACMSLALVGVDVGATSVNLALKDFKYVARSYLVTLAATAAYFAVCRQQGWGLGGVWWGLVLFFGVRALQSTVRAAWQVGLVPGAAGVPLPGGPGEPEAGKQRTEQASGMGGVGRVMSLQREAGAGSVVGTTSVAAGTDGAGGEGSQGNGVVGTGTGGRAASPELKVVGPTAGLQPS